MGWLRHRRKVAAEDEIGRVGGVNHRRATAAKTRRDALGKGQRELLLLILKLIEPVVDAAQSQKLLMRALFAQAPFVEDEDAVGVLNGAQAVGDHHGRAAGQQPVERFADQQLGLGIDAGGGFVEDQNFGSCARARAKLTSWRWPTESVEPRSVTGVSTPWWESRKPQAHFAQRAFGCGAIDGLGSQLQLDSSVPVKRNGSCSTMPKSRRKSCRSISRISTPSIKIWPRWIS